MLEWLKRRLSPVRGKPPLGAQPEQRRRHAVSGKYSPLYEYLEHRYAGTVVLTVAEIQDILGFLLPNAARVQQGWWDSPGQDGASPSHMDAWTQAGRTAKPNLVAQTVVFERAI